MDNGKTGSMCRSDMIFRGIMVLAGIASIAATSGYLIGRTENNSTIGAAVITALLGVLLAVLVFAGKSDNVRHSVLASLVTIVFCATFYVVMVRVIADVDKEGRDALISQLSLRSQLNELRLQQCSEAEFQINSDRKKVGLPPLPFTIVCEGQ